MKNTQSFLRNLTAILFCALITTTSCAGPRDSTNSESGNGNDFTVTFDGNGGTLISGVEVQTVKSAAEIVEPTYEKTGYNFNGWNKDISAIAATTTVLAKWQEKSSDTSISITGFAKEGNHLSAKVNNNIGIYTYTDKVTVASTSSWKLFSDIEGTVEVVTKTISLRVGDNVNYILVNSEKGDYAFYTVTLRRLNMFTVTFNTNGGNQIPSQQVQEESLIQAVSNPEKTGYTFSNWDYSFNNPVMENLTVNAIWSINKYTITWKNYSGSVLETDYNVPYGTTPSYNGVTPTRVADAQYSYVFSGWSPTITTVTGNQTYVAQYSTTTQKYTITWKNYSGSVLETDYNVPYGTTPSYNGVTPTRVAVAQYSYVFSGWSPSVVAVTSDATYYAEFTETERPITKGDTYQFGTYPQSKVTDATLLSTLNSARGTLPTSANSQAWTSYGYYISGSVSSYMWYIDITNATDEYRGVYFTSYRPYSTTNTSSTSNSWQDDNGYTTSYVYWFKYEPINWRVLDVQSSSAFLMADLVLDSQDYHYSTSNRTIGGSTVYANNYKESHIRSWLNDNFYNTAFTTEEKARIQTTNVDNSVASTGFSPNTYACANTSDKVFLLSYAEATSATYGLSTLTSRQLQPSAYAQSQGVYTYTSNGNSFWWLRSPSGDIAISARFVNYNGNVNNNNNVTYTHLGVVPALWISL